MQTLILGGARSGKSRYAEQLAHPYPEVVYIATATAGDAEMQTRITHHQAARPAHWLTVEEPIALAQALQTHAQAGRVLLVDCLTLWLNNLLCLEDGQRLQSELAAVYAILPHLPGELILVSNETGLGIIPLGELTRRYVDEAGRMHQRLAAQANQVVFMLAGLPHYLKGHPTTMTPHPTPYPTTPSALPTTDHWLHDPCQQPDPTFAERAQERQNQLTKPAGALGELETLAIRLASLQRCDQPCAEQVHISIFAGDHGVVAEGVSAFPQAVTQQMVANFLHGGAAISVLARNLGAILEIVDTGIIEPLPAQTGLIIQRAGAGTANSAQTAAMTLGQLTLALQAGYAAVERAYAKGADLFIGGEMGIGNTTPATVLYCALLEQSPETMTGAGTGLEQTGIQHKAGVIQHILERHQASAGKDALRWLQQAGGFEIAALTGAYIRAAQRGLPVLLDGFISTAAALVACRIQPDVAPWLLATHCSAERGHKLALAHLGITPLFNLGMRLGEGSGAAVAVPLLRTACYLHNQMATFAEAAVAGKNT